MRRLAWTLALLSLVATGCSGGPPTVDLAGPVDPPAPTPSAPSPIDDTSSLAPDDPDATTQPVGGADGSATTPPRAPYAANRTGPPFPADTADDTAEGTGFLVTVSDIRFARHDGFDRIVFDTGGDGQAGWHVGYVDQAITQGAGERLDLDGDAILEVDLRPTGYPDDTGTPAYDGPRRTTHEGVVAEIHHAGTFEGHTQVFVGLTSERPFRVFRLDDRVVLDIWHEGVAP